jgi:hypothetical protein
MRGAQRWSWKIKLGRYGDFSLGLFAMMERGKACRLRLGEDPIAIFGCHADLQLIRHSVICTVELCHGGEGTGDVRDSVTGQVRLHFFPQTTVQNFLDLRFGIHRILESKSDSAEVAAATIATMSRACAERLHGFVETVRDRLSACVPAETAGLHDAAGPAPDDTRVCRRSAALPG